MHRELPIRLAHRVRDLESVPEMLAQKSVQQVGEISDVIIFATDLYRQKEIVRDQFVRCSRVFLTAGSFLS